MQTQKVQLRFLRMAPRKVRLVAHSIKGLSVNEAEAQLITNAKRAGVPLLQLLRSAVSAAKSKNYDIEKMAVKEIRVDQAPMFKRWLPRAQGRATPIQKKGSHVILVLAESEKTKKSRFTIEKQKKLKKSEAAKLRKTELKEAKKEESKEKGHSETKGVKRIFRRKAV